MLPKPEVGVRTGARVWVGWKNDIFSVNTDSSSLATTEMESWSQEIVASFVCRPCELSIESFSLKLIHSHLEPHRYAKSTLQDSHALDLLSSDYHLLYTCLHILTDTLRSSVRTKSVSEKANSTTLSSLSLSLARSCLFCLVRSNLLSC